MVKKLTLAIIGIAVAFGLVEGYFRFFNPQPTGPVGFAFDPALGTMPTPRSSGVKFTPGYHTFSYHSNSLGLRGTREYGLEKTAPRLLLIGDSFTWGWGVNDDETFASELERRFAVSGTIAEVVNAGVGGKGTDYAIKFLETHGVTLKPDALAVFFYYNDYFDNGTSEYYRIEADSALTERSLTDTRTARKDFFRHIPLYDWFGRWSHAFNFVKNELQKVLLYTQAERAELTERSRAPMLSVENVAATKVFIGVLHREITREGIPLFFFYVPSREDTARYRAGGGPSDFEERLAEMLRAEEIPFTSLTPLVAGLPGSIDNLYYPVDEGGHWRAVTHRAVGDFLATFFAPRFGGGGR